MNTESFDVIPAIDILDGKCVRLFQGNYDKVEEFFTSPDNVAKNWVEAGAKRLHIVDLNGAKEGYPVNFKTIKQIIKSVRAKNVKLQVGGGVRTLDDIKNYLELGVDFLILGTKAFEDKAFFEEALGLFGQKIILSLDLKDKKLALRGWQEGIDVKFSDLNEYIGSVKQVVYTDINKDGTLSGPNLDSIKEIAKLLKTGIIVSGGISTLNDIVAILNAKKDSCPNIQGVILGKSLYKETIDLRSAIKLAQGYRQ